MKKIKEGCKSLREALEEGFNNLREVVKEGNKQDVEGLEERVKGKDKKIDILETRIKNKSENVWKNMEEEYVQMEEDCSLFKKEENGSFENDSQELKGQEEKHQRRVWKFKGKHT